MTTIYLVRHGQSTWNAAGRIQGKQDPPLSALGRRQAEAVAHTLRNETLDAIYSSQQRRARLTANTIAERHNVSITTVEGLAEIDHGDWEGLTEREVQQHFAAAFQMWLTRPSQTQMPGGEHCLSLQQRVLQAWQEIVAREDGNHVAVVSHDIPIKVIIAGVLGLDLDQIGHFVVGNAGISIVQGTTGRLRLTRLNDQCHLNLIYNAEHVRGA